MLRNSLKCHYLVVQFQYFLNPSVLRAVECSRHLDFQNPYSLVNLPQQELGASLPIATLIAVALCLLFLDAQHKREFPFHPYLYTIRNSLVTRYHFSLHTSFVKKEISLLTPLPISSL